MGPGWINNSGAYCSTALTVLPLARLGQALSALGAEGLGELSLWFLGVWTMSTFIHPTPMSGGVFAPERWGMGEERCLKFLGAL